MWEQIRWMWRGAQIMLLAVVLVRFFVSSDSQSEWFLSFQTMFHSAWTAIQSQSIAGFAEGFSGFDLLSDFWERLQSWFADAGTNIVTDETGHAAAESGTNQPASGLVDPFTAENADLH